MDNSKSPTSNAFALYLIIGMLLALLVVAVYAVIDDGNGAGSGTDRPVAMQQPSKPAGDGAGGRK